MSEEITIVHNEPQHRYAATMAGAVVGTSRYRIHDGKTIFYHTEVDPAFEGKGVGSALARGVLDDLRRRGVRLVPECPFLAAYIKRHPGYADLVDA